MLTVLGGFAILAFLYGQAHRQVSDRTSRTASLTARAQQAQAAAAQLAPYTSFVALREQRLQAVSQLVDSRFDWAHALHELRQGAQHPLLHVTRVRHRDDGESFAVHPVRQELRYRATSRREKQYRRARPAHLAPRVRVERA